MQSNRDVGKSQTTEMHRVLKIDSGEGRLRQIEKLEQIDMSQQINTQEAGSEMWVADPHWS